MHLLLLGLEFTCAYCASVSLYSKTEVSHTCEIFYSILKSVLLKGMFWNLMESLLTLAYARSWAYRETGWGNAAGYKSWVVIWTQDSEAFQTLQLTY